jgi:hypothetical protein
MKPSNLFWFLAGAYLSLFFDMAADPYRAVKKWQRLTGGKQ